MCLRLAYLTISDCVAVSDAGKFSMSSFGVVCVSGLCPRALDLAMRMLNAGIDVRTEPFLRALLCAARAQRLQVSPRGHVPVASSKSPTPSCVFPPPNSTLMLLMLAHGHPDLASWFWTCAWEEHELTGLLFACICQDNIKNMPVHCSFSLNCSIYSTWKLTGFAVPAVLQLIQELKKKTHIFVPDAARLLGVMDEVGVLSYGEVYVQIEEREGTRRTITGEVMVAKNPCFHPGDVRVLKVRITAIDILFPLYSF